MGKLVPGLGSKVGAPPGQAGTEKRMAVSTPFERKRGMLTAFNACSILRQRPRKRRAMSEKSSHPRGVIRQILPGLAPRRDLPELPVALVRHHVERAVRALPHVADTLPALPQQVLFAHHAVPFDDQPHEPL